METQTEISRVVDLGRTFFWYFLLYLLSLVLGCLRHCMIYKRRTKLCRPHSLLRNGVEGVEGDVGARGRLNICFFSCLWLSNLAIALPRRTSERTCARPHLVPSPRRFPHSSSHLNLSRSHPRVLPRSSSISPSFASSHSHTHAHAHVPIHSFRA